MKIMIDPMFKQVVKKVFKISAVLVVLPMLLLACASSPPRQVDNICSIFTEKSRWYKAAKKSEQRWGSPIPVMMAIMQQESSFVSNARPPRTKILWVIPGPRKSSAYGYPQAKDSTWKWYRRSSGRSGADRDDFADAIDFIGWYNTQTNKINNVKLNDTYRLYLAYHEGHGGFKRGTYKNKGWLEGVAAKVSRRANSYSTQLKACEKRLPSSGFSLWPF